MERRLRAPSFSLLAVGLVIGAVSGQQKLAQTGFNFLSVGTDARATAMGEAFTTVNGSSTALWYNPAGISGIESFMDLSTNQLTWIADIKYLSGAAAFSPFNGEYGVIGLSFLTVNYGTFHFTRVAANEQGYEDVAGYPKPSARMIGVGYAKELSTQFAVGGQVKQVYQFLGESAVPVYTNYVDPTGNLQTDTAIVQREYEASVIAFDFGTIYRTGWKGLTFGMSVSNFSKEIKYARENFQLPLTFKFGFSMNLMEMFPEQGDVHAFRVSVDAVHPRSYPELLNIGGEYVFSDLIALRFGYSTHHEDYGLTTGIGVRGLGFAVDYSYMPHDVFNDLQRFTVRFEF